MDQRGEATNVKVEGHEHDTTSVIRRTNAAAQNEGSTPQSRDNAAQSRPNRATTGEGPDQDTRSRLRALRDMSLKRREVLNGPAQQAVGSVKDEVAALKTETAVSAKQARFLDEQFKLTKKQSLKRTFEDFQEVSRSAIDNHHALHDENKVALATLRQGHRSVSMKLKDAMNEIKSVHADGTSLREDVYERLDEQKRKMKELLAELERLLAKFTEAGGKMTRGMQDLATERKKLKVDQRHHESLIKGLQASERTLKLNVHKLEEQKAHLEWEVARLRVGMEQEMEKVRGEMQLRATAEMKKQIESAMTPLLAKITQLEEDGKAKDEMLQDVSQVLASHQALLGQGEE